MTADGWHRVDPLDIPDDGRVRTVVVDGAAWRWPAAAAGSARWTTGAPGEQPILWPEHLDLGIRTADTNYGISPGDNDLPEPYAYVAPPSPRTGPFWNVRFGAARPMRELDGGSAAAVLAFFQEGRDRAV